MVKRVFCIGNGESRKGFDLETLRKHGSIYGCNALYRDFMPDVLTAVDQGIMHEIYHAGVAQKIPCYFRDWTKVPAMTYEPMIYGGMEKLEAEITFSEYDPELFRLFGIMDNSTVNFTLRGGLQGTGDAEPVVINLRGKIKELDSGSWKAGDKVTLKCMIAIFYYKLTIDRRELIEIDAENMIRSS